MDRPRYTRRRFLRAAGGIAAAGLAAEGLILEPRRLSVTRHQIGAPRAPGDRPLRLVQLTDVHLGPVGRLHERIAEAVESLAPDAVVLTGDSVDEVRGVSELAAFLALLPPRAARFATLGNWEYWAEIDRGAISSVYERGSCQLLVDDAAMLEHGGRTATILGLDDLIGGRPDPTVVSEAATGRPNVLVLAHCPAHRDRMPQRSDTRISAVLSGHTHGGQVAMGGWAPLRPPGSGPYVSGWYREDGPPLYVSRGLGTSVVPVRVGSVPEIAFFEWYLESA